MIVGERGKPSRSFSRRSPTNPKNWCLSSKHQFPCFQGFRSLRSIYSAWKTWICIKVIFLFCTMINHRKNHLGVVFWWFFTEFTMVNHHHSPPFGRRCLDFFPSIEQHNPRRSDCFTASAPQIHHFRAIKSNATPQKRRRKCEFTSRKWCFRQRPRCLVLGWFLMESRGPHRISWDHFWRFAWIAVFGGFKLTKIKSNLLFSRY